MLYQGELAHRALKAFYPLTNKLDTATQLATHEHRRRVLRRIAESGSTSHASKDAVIDVPVGFDLKHHHHIPTLSRNHPLDIFRFLRQHDNDPAVVVGAVPLSSGFILLTATHRDSSPNSKTTYCIASEGWTSVIAIMYLQITSATRLLFRTTKSTRFKQCRYV